MIFTSHDSLFVANYYRDTLILVLFVMYERVKGEDSFWHPYLDVLSPGIPTCYWDQDILGKSDYQEFKWGLETSRGKFEVEWE